MKGGGLFGWRAAESSSAVPGRSHRMRRSAAAAVVACGLGAMLVMVLPRRLRRES
jgi:hypothetical protein